MPGELSSLRRTLALCALGIAFDYSFHGQSLGVSTPLFFTLLAATLFVQLPDVRSRIVLGAAAAISVFPALLASPSLAALDVLAAAGLLGIAAAHEPDGLLRTSARGVVLAGLRLLRLAFAAPRVILRPLAPLIRRIRLDRAGPPIRALAVAVPVVAIFAILLASADQVFADFITPSLPDWNISNVTGHILLTLTGVFLCGVLWLSAAGAPSPGIELPAVVARLPRISSQQWTLAVAGVLGLFSVFVFVQLAFLFGGRHRVEVTPGLTYAEYARSGFFQLIAVAVLTVFFVTAVWDLGDQTDRRRFRTLVGGIVGLSFVILLSALSRLRLYERTFGFTLNRFFAYVLIGWIAIVFFALLYCLWRKKREHFVATILATGLLVVIGTNIANPERFVAERNADRWRSTGRLDASYLGYELGAEAIPVIASLLREVPPEDAALLLSALCSHSLSLRAEPSWRSNNLGRARAKQALASAGIGPSACEFG